MVQQDFGSGRQAQAGRGRELTRERIEEVDEHYASPKTRAEEVHAALQIAQEELGEDLSRYDMLCFSVQFIAMMAIGELDGDDDLLAIAKVLNKWLHERHYFHAEEIFENSEEADR